MRPGSAFALREAEAAAREVGIALRVFEVRAASDIDAALSAAARGARAPGLDSASRLARADQVLE